MRAQNLPGMRRADPLPPLSPSPQRSHAKPTLPPLSNSDADSRAPLSTPLSTPQKPPQQSDVAPMERVQVPGRTPGVAAAADGSVGSSIHSTAGSLPPTQQQQQQQQRSSQPTPTPPQRTRLGAPRLSCSTLTASNPNGSPGARSSVSATEGVAELRLSTATTATTATTTSCSPASLAKNPLFGSSNEMDGATRPPVTLSALPMTNGSAIRTPSPPDRAAVFSSSESKPRVSSPHPALAGFSPPPAVATIVQVPVCLTGGPAEDDEHGGVEPSLLPPPPHCGVFLQPSTFRVGATGGDVLWALYRSNGIIANYLDVAPATHSAASGGTGDVMAGASGGAADRARLDGKLDAATPSAASTPAARAHSTRRRSSSVHDRRTHSGAVNMANGGSTGTAAHQLKAQQVPLITLSASAREAIAAQQSARVQASSGPDAAGGAGGGGTRSTTALGGGGAVNFATFLEIEAEVTRCLSGAGGSTPCLLSFEYEIRPARARFFSASEAATLHRDPVVLELSATHMNAMETVVRSAAAAEGGERDRSEGRAQAAPASRLGRDGTVATAEGDDKGLEETPHASEKRAWLEAVVAAAAAAAGTTTAPTASNAAAAVAAAASTAAAELQRRRRACAEVIQSSLFAARRAADSGSRLFLCEAAPADPHREFAVRGSVSHALAGAGAAGDGARLMPSPLWNGVQVALATMLVGEEATFIMAPDDTTRFSAPLDDAACVRSAANTSSLRASSHMGASTSAFSTAAGASGTTWQGGRSVDTPPTLNGSAARPPTVNFAPDEPRAMTFISPHSRHPYLFSADPGAGQEAAHSGKGGRGQNASAASGDGGGGGGGHRKNSGNRSGKGRRRSDDRHYRPRRSSNNTRRSSAASAVDTSPCTSPASSRVSSVGPNGTPRAQQRKQQKEQRSKENSTSTAPPPPSPPVQSKSTSFLSRVREWGRKARRTSGDDRSRRGGKEAGQQPATSPDPSAAGEKEKEKEKGEEVPRLTTLSPPRGHSNVASRHAAPHATEAPVTAAIGALLQSAPRPPQRRRSWSRGDGAAAPLPTCAAPRSHDVLAYEAAVYGAAEPLVVVLRLTERIPLLPTASTSAQPQLLVSAECVPETVGSAESVPPPSTCLPTPPAPPQGDHEQQQQSYPQEPREQRTGGALGGSPFTTLPASRLSAAPRTVSNLSAGALSASTATTSTASDSTRGRNVMTDALLCLRESNVLAAHLATTFHCIAGAAVAAAGAGGQTARRRGSLRSASTAGSVPASPSKSLSSPSSRGNLARMMVSLLDSAEARTAARGALFTALTHVMDGRLLTTRERSHMLEHCVGATAATQREAAVVSDTTGAEALDVDEAQPCAADAVVAAGISAASAPPASSSSSPPVPQRYLWRPTFRLRDAVDAFARHWHGGSFSRGRGQLTPAISGRALHRTLDAFTRYAHETCTVTYSIDVFNPLTRTYVPFVSPLMRSACTRTSADGDGSAGAESMAETGASRFRSSVGCVLHPCWLDAVLQAGRYGCGTELHVVTRGYAAELEERVFVCAALTDVAVAAQEAAIAFSTPPAVTAGVVGTAPPSPSGTAPTDQNAQGVGDAAATGLGKAEDEKTNGEKGSHPHHHHHHHPPPSTPKAPPTPSGASHRSALLSAALSAASGGVSPSKSSKRGTPAKLPVTSAFPHGAHSSAASPLPVHTAGETATDRANAMARRSLASNSHAQLKQRGGEQRYRVHVHACEPMLTPRHFFAHCAADGLAAARALLADAAVLLDYYYAVMDRLGGAGQGSGAGASLPHTHCYSSPSLQSPRLSAAVAPALRGPASSFRARAQHSRQRLPYLLYGDDRHAIHAAATARAQAMGHDSLVSSTTDASHGAPPASPSPPIETVAAALLLFSPSASSAACTLATRIPLALDRILLKVLPLVHLAVFLLTYGVEEGTAVPAGAIEHVYGPWWSQANAAMTATGMDASATGRSTQDARGSSRNGSIAGTTTAAPALHPLSLVTKTKEEEKLCLRRYEYLGECFHSLALVYAELPGMGSLSGEACTMALLYAPRDAALWGLWAVLTARLGKAGDARTALRIAVQLLTLEEEEEEAAESNRFSAPTHSGEGRRGEGGRVASSPVRERGVEDRAGRAALVQFLHQQCC